MIKLRAFSFWFLLLLIAAAILIGPAAAQDTHPGQQADPAALPFGAEPGTAAPAPHKTTAVGDWSMLAYQKLQDNNWEIYVHDKSGGPRRLTFNNSIDQHPSLDRGTQRVAFVSNRSGDLDLYTMSVDGLGLKRILDNKSSIAFPA